GTESTMGRAYICLDGKIINVKIKGEVIYKNIKDNNTGRITKQRQDKREIDSIEITDIDYKINNLSNVKPFAYILERPGPDSIAGEVNLRIPEGRYNVMWNDGNMKGVLKLFNNYLSKGRAILIHGGNTPKHSAGCLLIGDNIQSDIINGEPMAKLLADLIKSKLCPQIKQSNESIKNFVRNCIEIQIVNTITKDIK
ncbi:DUF5675 family protein, partial [Helicobacter sp. T3_23-1059]